MDATNFIQQISALLNADYTPHEDFLPDIVELVKTEKEITKFFGLFTTRLIFLSENGTSAVVKLPKQFEKLKGGSPFYSMHMAVIDKNIRILYFHGNTTIYLLHAFFERGGKRATDYTHAIEVAYKRLNDLIFGGIDL